MSDFFYPAIGSETGLRDSNGRMICIGDIVRTEVTCNTDFHGSWADYQVLARGMIPVLFYMTSEKGVKLPRGHIGCSLADKYDQKMFLWAIDLNDIRPDDEMFVVASSNSNPTKPA